ncbi:MAG TPA: hypothetical protein VGS01_00075, partial [Candidatus Limnocylindria bacterium]|nr:hypothetical protein [Candidatus Limnocylindria bacterium]
MATKRLRALTTFTVLATFVLALASSLLSSSPSQAASPDAPAAELVPLLIKFRANATATEITAAVRGSGGVVSRDLGQLRTKVINVPAGARDRILAA